MLGSIKGNIKYKIYGGEKMKCRTVMQGISLFLASSIALVGCSGNKVELRSQTDFQRG